MPQEYSFDVVSKVDDQELDNALNQARKEIAGRFDFKNTKTTIELAGSTITIVSDDELKMRNVLDIVQGKATKRGISLKAFEYGKVEPASQGSFRQTVTVKSGIPKDKSRALIDAIKAAKVKAGVQYQDEQLRVSSKAKDELQKVQEILRGLDYELPLQFVNYR
ncbi:MAG: YajQ family cyclic di-GMP-binding protein [Candidatus Eremiobacteraeota bacterium]|nr:YajQ family cyclic di-GMP-binding protein [Candidatus Eremiobacteraeota bacterium]